MKNKLILASLALILPLISSCGDNSKTNSSLDTSSASSETSSSIEESSSSSTDTYTEEDRAFEQEIRENLTEMKKGNFTLGYNFSDIYLEDVITPNYFYTAYLNNGSLLLNVFDDNKIGYDYQIADDSIELKGQTFNEEQTGQGITSLAYMNKMSSLDVSKLKFAKYKNTLVSEDQSLIKVLSAQLDFSSGLQRVLFYKEDGYLTFELQYYAYTPAPGYQTPQGGKVTIKNIGTSSIASVESFLASWTKPTETLQGKGDNIFGNVSLVSSIYDYSIDYQRAILEGTINFDIYNSFLRVVTLNEDDVPYSTTYERQTGDELKIIGVDGHNEVREISTSKKYSDFSLIGKEGFELNNFLKIDEEDNYYLYMGSNAQALAYSITQSSIFSRYKCLKIQVGVKDNKITDMHFYTGNMQDADTGEFFFYRIDTKILETPNVITKSDKKTPSADDAKIKEYLSLINSSSFEAELIDSAWNESRKTYISKGADFFLKETYFMSEGEKGNLETASGYYYKDGKTYAIFYNNYGSVEIKGIYSKSLVDMINFSISSEILSLKDATLKTSGDIINLGDSLGFINYKDYIDPATLKMQVEDEKINSLYYEYGGDGFSGNETINFTYKEVSLSETLMENIEKAIPEGSTWESYTGNSAVYEALIEGFGKEIADKTPYLADDLFNGDGTFDGYYYDGEVFIYSMATDNGYLAKYKAYLLKLGYTSTDNKTFTNSTDNLKIVVGDTLDDFVHISLLA